MTDAEAFERSRVVFRGEVVDHVPPPDPDNFSSMDPVTWVFEVEEVYKGEVGAIQEIVSVADGASCGLEVAPGGEYFVFAGGDGGSVAPGPGQFYAGLCGGTRVAAGEPLDVPGAVAAPPAPVDATTALDQAAEAAGGEAGPAESPDRSVTYVTLALVGLAVAGALVVLGANLLGRRRRS